jgi:hypothetical protein
MNEHPKDCSVITHRLDDKRKRRECLAFARWLLVSPEGQPIRFEWPACNVHRAELVNYLLPNPAPPGWVWIDRTDGGVYAAHVGCLGSSSLGRRQTCQGAGSPSMAFCPLTGDRRSGNPLGTERRGDRETLLR